MPFRITLLALVLLLGPWPAKSSAPDTIVVGGVLYTLADDLPSPVEALAVADGAVVATGSRAEIERMAGPDTQVLDLGGAYAMPGLVDAHAHLFNLGKLLTHVDLTGTTSAEDCLRRARQHAASLPEGEWLQGRGWDQNDWEVQEYPTKEMLDDAFDDRPVCLRRVDGHASWVNSAALRRAGFDASTPDPPGGEILRDGAGELVGIVIDAADDALRARIDDPTGEQADRLLVAALQEAARNGLTGVHDMGLSGTMIAAIERVEKDRGLDVRIVGYLGGDEVLARFEGGPRRGEARERFRIDGVKLYADGALGSRGAALLEDYSDRPGHRGLLQATPEDLTQSVADAMERGFSVAIHAIGDLGNRTALDAIEGGYAQAGARTLLAPLRTLRTRVEHAQILHPKDMPRFAALGILPSMQPTHCTSDMPWAPSRVGADRIEGAYAWRTLRDLGNIVPLGSDFPVESVSPLLGLYAARTRRGIDGEPPGGWAPEQVLTPLEALLGFTVWPAWAAGVDTWGRLAEGYRADITVLDVDPLAADATALLRARVLWTMVDGVVHHRAP